MLLFILAADIGKCNWYTVQPGDSPWTIAAKFNVLQDDLKAAFTQCIAYTDSSVLQVGQSVCLPPYYDACKSVSYAGLKYNCQFYSVQPGDTIDSIASALNIYNKDLAELNKDVIQPGQPLQQGTKIKLMPWNNEECPDLREDVKPCRFYKVKAGDILRDIANMFSLNDVDVLAANPGMVPDAPLVVGQQVRVLLSLLYVIFLQGKKWKDYSCLMFDCR